MSWEIVFSLRRSMDVISCATISQLHCPGQGLGASEIRQHKKLSSFVPWIERGLTWVEVWMFHFWFVMFSGGLVGLGGYVFFWCPGAHCRISLIHAAIGFNMLGNSHVFCTCKCFLQDNAASRISFCAHWGGFPSKGSFSWTDRYLWFYATTGSFWAQSCGSKTSGTESERENLWPFLSKCVFLNQLVGFVKHLCWVFTWVLDGWVDGWMGVNGRHVPQIFETRLRNRGTWGCWNGSGVSCVFSW